MIFDDFADAYILAGPTASGKSELGVELAEQLNAEIVSMDSMALFRGMDIGTAKPGPEWRSRVRHHLIDVLDPWESGSVAWWLDQARQSCHEIESRGKRVLFVGGTPLYLKALLRGLFDGPPRDPELRLRLSQEGDRQGYQVLHQRLAQVDPVSASRLHPHDIRRVVRALEVWEITGRPISAWQQQWNPAEGGMRNHECGMQSSQTPLAIPPSAFGIPHSQRCLWLDVPREELYARINDRVRRMMAEGWLDEATRLRQLERPLSREAAQALGYREVFAYLDGQAANSDEGKVMSDESKKKSNAGDHSSLITHYSSLLRGGLEDIVERIQIRSRHFAKRQISWFRHLPECRPVTRELTFKLWGLTMK